MKYGPVICDPTSDEARALIGKEVLVSDIFYNIKAIPEDVTCGILLKIEEKSRFPFVFISEGNEDKCVFIREVIE